MGAGAGGGTGVAGAVAVKEELGEDLGGDMDVDEAGRPSDVDPKALLEPCEGAMEPGA
jgi:hypothetical protein